MSDEEMREDICCGGCGYPIHQSKETACAWCRQTADRIEELTAEVRRLEAQCNGLACAAINNGQGLIIAEAKLAEAMENLKRLAGKQLKQHDELAASLAELKGETDE